MRKTLPRPMLFDRLRFAGQGAEAKTVEHEHRLLRRLHGVRALRETCAAEREADRLRKVRRRYVSDARTHADQNGKTKSLALTGAANSIPLIATP